MCITGINDTGGKFAACVNCTSGKFATFATGTTGVVDTGGRFATGVNDTGVKLPPVPIPAANLPLVSMTPVANIGNNIRLLTPYNDFKGKNLFIL